MTSFDSMKLQDAATALQLLVNALVVDPETKKVNDKTLYTIISAISTSDENRTGDIKGTIAEQLVALNDSISSLKTAIDRTNSLLDYIDDSVGHADSDTGYIRIMPSDGTYWTT